MNREMLKECIADAKTIRETAIASAKLALEEAFTPQLTAMFAEKLNELEEEEEMNKKSKNEMYSMEEETNESFNLEELLAELSMEENDKESMEKEGMEPELEENLMLEDMSDEEIEELVMQVIDDMIKSGKLMPGEGEEEDMEDMDDMEDMGGEEDVEIDDEEVIDEDINLEELLAEMDDMEEKPMKENEQLNEFSFNDLVVMSEKIASQLTGPNGPAIVLAGIGFMLASPFVVPAAKKGLEKLKNLINSKKKLTKDEIQTALANDNETSSSPTSEAKKDEATNTEMEETINELRNELNEVNLLNAKLLYTNKIFKAKNLTESEKIKVLNTFDKAENVKEVKLVFETLTESFKTTTVKKNPIRESLGSASKTISTATPKQPIIESNEAFARMQRLAGLRK
jgi:hypothetical protein